MRSEKDVSARFASAVGSAVLCDPVMIFAVSAAVFTSLFHKPDIGSINFDVLILLFDLMIITAALSELCVPDVLAVRLIRKCRTKRLLSFVLVFVTFAASMLITNDVALLAFVPLTLIVGKETNTDVLHLVILQTLAANAGSALTPMGNPQNLYLYVHYGIGFTELMLIMAPFVLVSSFLIVVLLLRESGTPVRPPRSVPELGSRRLIAVYAILFGLTILSVARLIPEETVFVITVLAALVLDPRLFGKVNYSLLITFAAFFVFVGNISAVPAVQDCLAGILETPEKTYVVSAAVSQIISNVPAAILLSGFTPHAEAILSGVNVGGAGTLVASMASVITYKLYVKKNPGESFRFLKVFTVYGFPFLLVTGAVVYVFMFF